MIADMHQIPALRKLWQQAFGDTEETLDAFFATCFSHQRCNVLCVDDQPVSALYWFDCRLNDAPLAYLYACATEKALQGQGYFRRLMEDTHALLKNSGYAGAVLVPGNGALFAMYRKFGYRTVSTVREFTCTQGETAVSLRPLDQTQYAQARLQYLPNGGIIQEGPTLAYLQTQVQFFAGNDFLLAANGENGTLQTQELLGNPAAAPGILRALNLPHGRFRIPGPGRDFAMFLPFSENCPVPAYFGLALD